MNPDDKEYMYFNKLDKDTLSVSQAFPNSRVIDGEEITRYTRGVSMKFGNSADHKMSKRIETKDGVEIHLRTTESQQQEIKAYFYEDTRKISSLTIQRWMTKTGNAHKDYMTLVGDEIDLLLKFANSLKGIPLEGKGRVTIPLNVALEKVKSPKITDEEVLT
ncbi:MAG: hypothetical protein JXQ76_03780 [Campylobacterales bacterium]|nr:hypothetical protein [Campylobacterales bacterium]